MPYAYKKKGDKFFCYNKETGELKDKTGHATEHEAVAHMRALYRAESGASMTGKKGKKFRVRRKKK